MIVFLAVALFFFLTLIPYCLFESVQLVYLLHAFHKVRPDLWSRDWYITQTQDPHPFFSSVVALFYSLQVLPQAFFWIHVIQFALLALGIFRLCRLLTADPRIPFLVSLFLLLYFPDGLGQSTLYSSIVQPTELAVPFYLLSVCSMFEGKPAAAFALLGLSGLFHVHFATNGLIVLTAFYAFQKYTSRRTLLGGLALFVLLASPNLIPILKNFSFAEPLQSPGIFKIFLNFRSPHHYRPSTFELSHAFRTLFPVFFLLIADRWLEKKTSLLSARVFTAAVLILCATAVAFTEGFLVPFIARFFFFRLSPFVLLIGLVSLASVLTRDLYLKRTGAGFMCVTTLVILFLERDSRLFIPLSLLLIIIWVWRAKMFAHPPQSVTELLMPATAFSMTAVLFVLDKRTLEFLILASLASVLILILKMDWRNTPGRVAACTLILALPTTVLHWAYPKRLHFHPIEIQPAPRFLQENKPLAGAMSWMRNHTDKNALLLSPPYQNGIRFFTERSIVADFQAHGYRASEFTAWKDRLETMTRTRGLEDMLGNLEHRESQSSFLRKKYLGLKTNDVEKIAQGYGADYFMTESSYPERKLLEQRGHTLAFQNSSYLIFRLNPNP